MKVAALALAALLLTNCATTSPPRDRHWLFGSWLMLAEDIEYPLACASGLPIHYSAEGTYHLFEESGTWRTAGDRLTETVTEVHDSGDPAVSEPGRSYRSRIARAGPDEFRKTFANGTTETFRRCPGP